MNKHSDSPLLAEVLSWVKKKDMGRLRTLFVLDPYLAYITNIDFSTPGPAPRIISRKSTLDKRREEIRTEVVKPLFNQPSLNVRFEANCRRHRKDNAYCCLEFHRKRIEKIPGRGLEAALEEFRSDWQLVLSGARFPFSWIIDHRDPAAKEQAELDNRMAHFVEEIRRRKDEAESIRDLDPIVEELDAMEGWTEIQNKNLAWAHILAKAENELKRQYVLDVCKAQLLPMMKWARAKPGRHPKEFNVLVYHVIKKCTHRKFDRQGKPIMREVAWKRLARTHAEYRNDPGLNPDGTPRSERLHRLVTDWKLVMFLLLDLHVHEHDFPEFARFLSRHKKERASVALRTLQAWLLNISKNFPSALGWIFPRGLQETGFRKLIVTEDGGLKGIRL